MEIPSPARLAVKKSRGKGLGVFATEQIRKGEIIEIAPVIFVKTDEACAGTGLADYVYVWNDTHCGVALGYGSLYNHSHTPNAKFLFGKSTLTYKALHPIARGEEITINYDFDPSPDNPSWFEAPLSEP